MHQKIYKTAVIISAVYLLYVGGIEVLGMLWFFEDWGAYLPIGIYMVAVGIVYVVFVARDVGGKVTDVILPVSASIGVYGLFLIHQKRMADGATEFTIEYLGYLAFIMVAIWPSVRGRYDA